MRNALAFALAFLAMLALRDCTEAFAAERPSAAVCADVWLAVRLAGGVERAEAMAIASGASQDSIDSWKLCPRPAHRPRAQVSR